MGQSPRQSSKFKNYLITVTIVMAIGLLAYVALGHLLIRMMYAGSITGPLNKIIDVSKPYPLEYYLKLGDSLFYINWLSVFFLLVILPTVFSTHLFSSWEPVAKYLEQHTDQIDAIPPSQVGWYILLAAGLTLFMELLIIRLHSSYFQMFSYFKNISLLSCFLGLGIGYSLGKSRPLTTPLAIPLLAIQIIYLFIIRASPLKGALQNPVTEQLTLGAFKVGILVHLFIAAIFAFNALCFIPLGQVTSRLMLRYPKLVSYGWNLAGSLAGILLFSLLSFLWTPPVIWILVAGAFLLVFLRWHPATLYPSLAAVLVLALLLTIPSQLNRVEIYSPYQILNLIYSKNEPPKIEACNAYYQRILDLRQDNIKDNDTLRKWSQYYSLPYYFKAKPDQVLIVGSGTGNDVAAALRNGAREIDAVEIDPAILKFGKELHPEAPYAAPNVNVIVDDARAFIRHTKKRYDLIVYGLLDSHTLLASKSGGIRLDSYVYTVEAFKEARSKLKKDGLISLTFCIMRPAIGRKLFLMLQEAFSGVKPIVYQVGYDEGYTFLASNGLKRSAITLPSGLIDVTDRFADNHLRADKSTDDWPFFYMPVRKYPLSYLALMLILLGISAIFTRKLITEVRGGFSFPCFFLGAGFMLIETKGITELALVYGSTWVVISVVISAILVMAFLANLLVIKMGTPSPYISYGFLFASILAGLGLTYFNPGGLNPWLSRIFMTTVLTLPLFFSGFVFSTELQRSVSVAVALSSNLLGAMLGGFLEYNSMYFGFRSLYFIAFLTYGLAFVWSVRAKVPISASEN